MGCRRIRSQHSAEQFDALQKIARREPTATRDKQLVADDRLLVGVKGTNGQHWNVAQGGIGLFCTQQFKPRHLRHQQVEHHRVGVQLAQSSQPLDAVCGRDNPLALWQAGQNAQEQPQHVRLVVAHQHCPHLRPQPAHGRLECFATDRFD